MVKSTVARVDWTHVDQGGTGRSQWARCTRHRSCTVTESQEPTEDAQDPGLQTDGDRDGV